MNFLKNAIAGMLIFLAATLPRTGAAETVADVLAMQKAPVGVVFEIVSDDNDRLEQVLPPLRKDIERLREKFPKLDIAVVSHGDEQFALSNDKTEGNKATRYLVQSLVDGDKVTFHVCGTYAQMRGVDAGAFPSYVDVAPHGPSQIRNYVDFGYLKIVVN